MIEPRTFEEIEDPRRGQLYPRHLLEGCKTALVLFAAGFYGANDAYWIVKAGIKTVCVDRDVEKMDVMARLYPKSCKFRVYDWLEFLDNLPSYVRYDIVSVDCPLNLTADCATTKLPTLLGITDKVLTLTTLPGFESKITAHADQAGFDTQLVKRSGMVCWAILTRR